MKKSDFGKLPKRERYDADIGEVDSVVIIPTGRKHDSGYMCLDFAACKDGEALCLLSGCSDVIHIDGIGGYGPRNGYVPNAITPKGWSIDCLPCGYLNLWCNHYITVGPALSSFEVLGSRSKHTR